MSNPCLNCEGPICVECEICFKEIEEYDRYIDDWDACQSGFQLSRDEIQKLMVSHGTRNLHNPL